MSSLPCKINVSDECRHMIRLYMVHHRLPNMQVAVANMVEAVTKSEGPYRYAAPPYLSNNGKGERKVG